MLARNPSVANTSWIAVAADWPVACFSVGIIGILVARYVQLATWKKSAAHYSKLLVAVVQGDSEGIAKENAEYQSTATHKLTRLWVLAFIGDVLFAVFLATAVYAALQSLYTPVPGR
jgi:hypothetical protein